MKSEEEKNDGMKDCIQIVFCSATLHYHSHLFGVGPLLISKFQHDVRTAKSNKALAIFRSEEDAATFINASPLRFTLEPVVEEKNFIDSIFAEDEPNPSSSFSSSSSSAQSPESSENNKDSELESENINNDTTTPITPSARAKKFMLTADAASVNLRDLVNSNPFFGPFVIDPSAVQEDLATRVPRVGMSFVDIRRPPQWSRIVNRTITKAQSSGLRALIQGEAEEEEVEREEQRWRGEGESGMK